MHRKLSIGLLALIALMPATSSSAQQAPGTSVGCEVAKQDEQSAVMTKIAKLRSVSWCEVILVCGAGEIFGTGGLNEPGDSCPWSIWQHLDRTALAKEYQIKEVLLNPPRGRRFFVLDSVDLPVSPNVRDFAGLKVHWWAEIPAGSSGREPYVPAPVERKSVFTFDAGNHVVLLDDPHGVTWMLVAYVTAADPTLTYENLPTLAQKLKIPAGWKFRSKVLDQTISMIPVNGKARIMWDEMENAWDACDPGVCSSQP